VAVLVSRARRALQDPSLIVAATGGYLFTAGDNCTVDAELFLDYAERGRAHLDLRRADAALKEFRAALESWAGEPLPEDTYSDWSREYRERLLRSYVQVLEGGAEAALELGDVSLAETLAARAVAREPLRETGHLLLMRALAASGNQAAALATFDALKLVLAEELAVEPSREALGAPAAGRRRPPCPRPTRAPSIGASGAGCASGGGASFRRSAGRARCH